MDFLEKISCILSSNSISVKATIGEGSRFLHGGVGCVIHEKAIIGKNCVICQNVTIGAKLSYGSKDKVHIVGDNVLICAGAVLVGDITIGSNSIIGANAVVIADVKPRTVVGGVPAKEIGVI